MFRHSFDTDLKVVCLVVPVGMPVATHENILFFIFDPGGAFVLPRLARAITRATNQ